MLTASGIFLLIFFIFLLLLISKPKAEKTSKARFKQKPLMSAKEQEFYSLLINSEMFSDFNIFPQVSMNAFIDAFEWRDRNHFDRKYVDFLICDKKSNAIFCVIELDGKEHQKKQNKDMKRDALLKEAGISTLRYQNNRMPTPEKIKQDMLNLIEKEA